MSTRTAKIIENLANGLGATKLDPSVRKVSLVYAFKGKNECMGAKYFYRENLPRMKFANPAVEFVVSKSTDAKITPTLTIEFADETKKVLEVPRMRSEEICKQFFEAAASPSATL